MDSSRQIAVRRSALQPRVIANVVVVEWLLDHHEIEPVELGEPRRVLERVGGVGVDHERDVAEPLADALDRVRRPTPA